MSTSVYYSMDNFSVQLHQILLSQKQKTFPQFFSAFLKSTLNFEYFQKKDDPHQKKDDPHSQCISEITVSLKGD